MEVTSRWTVSSPLIVIDICKIQGFQLTTLESAATILNGRLTPTSGFPPKALPRFVDFTNGQKHLANRKLFSSSSPICISLSKSGLRGPGSWTVSVHAFWDASKITTDSGWCSSSSCTREVVNKRRVVICDQNQLVQTRLSRTSWISAMYNHWHIQNEVRFVKSWNWH